MKLCAVVVIVVLGAGGVAADVDIKVVSADGVVLRSDTHEPIPGARVRLTLRSQDDREETLGWETTTDGSGRFVFPAVPARRIFAVTVRGPALALHRPIDLFATGHSARHFPPIEVPPSVPHAGVVRDHEGKPLAGAAIELLVRRNLGPPNALSGFSGGSFELVHETASDSEGRFTVWRSVTEPEGILRAKLPKYAPSLEVLRATRKEPIEIRLERAISLSGRTVDTWGTPVAGARVSARPRLVACQEWIDLLEERAISGPDGSFVIAGLLSGESYNVLGDQTEVGFVWEAGRDDARKTLVLAFSDVAPERTQTDPDTTARFAGKVVDAKTGTFIDGAQIELWPPGHGKHSEIGTASDALGRFELFELPSGHEFLLTVRAPGYRPIFDDIRLPDGVLAKDYTLEPTPVARIECRDPTGKTLANVPVALFIGGSDLSHLYARAITDLNGECALDGASTEQITRGVDFFDRNAGCCVTVTPRAREGSRFSFEVAPARIRGTVTDARGNRIAGASARIWQETVLTDRNGAFEVPVAPTGKQSIEFEARRMIPQTITVVFTADQERVIDVTLEDDARYQVVLMDDLSRPVEGIANEKEVSDASGRVHVPAGEALAIYKPFYPAMYLTEPTRLETVDPSEARLRPGENRITLERCGRIGIRLDPEPFTRCRKFEYPRIRLKSDRASIDDPRIWFSGSRQALVIDGVPPGRHDIQLETFGPYLPAVIARVEVRPQDTAWIEHVTLIEGATIIVHSKSAVEWRSGGWAAVCEFKGEGDDATGKGASSWIDEGFLVEGVPPGSGSVGIEMPGHYEVRVPVNGLKLGERRELTMELERFPRIRGRVILPGGVVIAKKLLWLRAQLLDASGQPKEGEEADDIPVDKDGGFEVHLRDGSHALSLLDQEDPGIENLPKMPVGLTPAQGWRIAGDGRLEVLRGRDIERVEILLEPAEK